MRAFLVGSSAVRHALSEAAVVATSLSALELNP